MITRIWHGRTTVQHADDYLDFLLTAGSQEYLETPGNIRVTVWRNKSDQECHFYTISEWTDFAAIKAFAGEEYCLAKYYPQDYVLLEKEKQVEHYECFEVSHPRMDAYVRQLKDLYDGSPWYGDSMLVKLEGINDRLAFQQPHPDMLSIAEITRHIIHWRTVLIELLTGNATYNDTHKDENFLPLISLKEKGWVWLKTLLAESQAG